MKRLIATDLRFESIGNDIIERLNNDGDMFNPFFRHRDFKFSISGRPSNSESGYIVTLKCIEPKRQNTALRIQFQQQVRGKVISIVRTHARQRQIPFNSSDSGTHIANGIHVRTDRVTKSIQISIKPW